MEGYRHVLQKVEMKELWILIGESVTWKSDCTLPLLPSGRMAMYAFESLQGLILSLLAFCSYYAHAFKFGL